MVGRIRRLMHNRWSLIGVTTLLLLGLVVAPFLPVYSSPPVRTHMAIPIPGSSGDVWTDDRDGDSGRGGLPIFLSEGGQALQPVETVPLAPATPLDEAALQPILDRLPPLVTDSADVQEFRLPEDSLPAPRTGDIIPTLFPPEETLEVSEAPVAGPLEVLRFSPEGEIPLAPFLSVTFNQPMIPLATVEQLTAQEVPVRITPALPGIWRWVGTRTLTFEYAGGEHERFPMATVFSVEVPAGTRAVTGAELTRAVTWTFSTPAPKLTSYSPSYGPQSRTPLLFAAFDQRIDPAAVLATIRVTAGGRSYPLRLATDDEIAADTAVVAQSKLAGEGRWLAFRSDESFPPDTTVVVNIGPGTPSAEGPRTTEVVQAFSFQTYAPLRIEFAGCSWGGSECPPMTPFEIRVNNPLDADAFDESWFKIEPEIPGLTINNFGYSVQFSGATQGRTTYRLTVDAALRDAFGQTLGESKRYEIRTGAADRVLYGPYKSLVTLDPAAGKPTFSVYSVNFERLRVRAYAVTPEDWPAYLEFLNERWRQTPPPPPGREVLSSIVRLDAQADTLTETAIDLSSAAAKATGHLVVIVDFPPNPLRGNQRDYNQVIAWVQMTSIGLDAISDAEELLAWTTNLADGAPLFDVEVYLLGTPRVARTDSEGVARLSLPDTVAPLLVARRGTETAILPRSDYAWYGDGWARNRLMDEVRWFVFDDRALYRPGEDVHVKGWLRRVGAGKGGDVALLAGATSVSYAVMDPRYNLLVQGSTDVNSLGGFDFSFTLPTNANLGYASIQLSVNWSGAGAPVGMTSYQHSFQIQEFRRPEFEVRARTEEKGPFFAGGSAVVAATASYFAGGPLPNADTRWSVTASPGSYSPPNWPDFIFGTWTPWWVYRGPSGESGMTVTYEGRTDPSGTHYLRMDFGTPDQPQPYSVRAEAVVMDVNRQAFASSTSLLVHPADLYVGIAAARTFVQRGEPLEIRAIVTDLDGNAVEDRPIRLRAVRLQWKVTRGVWNQEEVDPQECTVGSLLEPVSCTFNTDIGGTYRIRAEITDGMGRVNRSEFTRWVSGGKQPVQRSVELEEVTLIPDREFYQPGEIAEVLVQSPFVPAQGLATLNRAGIVTSLRFTMTESSYTLRLPIEEAYLPDITLNVELVGAAPRTDDQGEPLPELPVRPAYAAGEITLNVPPLRRTLAVEATLADRELMPGGETTLDLVVLDAAGQPVQDAELAVVIVDEAVLALTGYQMADPVATFYRSRGSGINTVRGRASLILADPAALAKDLADGMVAEQALRSPMPTMAAPAADAPPPGAPQAEMAFAPAMADEAMSESEGGAAITVRTDFNPLAVFAPAVRTDAAGRATVAVRVPDNLTRYRVMVVAVAGGTLFGATESNLTARLPLMVRPSAPRFLNFGDRFELPVVVQNQTAEPLTVDVVVNAGNLLLTDGQGRRVEIPANDRREVRFPATTLNAGTVRLQIAAVAGEYADAATVDLPVYTPATTEAFAVYGVVDQGSIVQPIAALENVFPQFGGLEISTSSTALQALTDAMLYLLSYEFECSEQIASRILGVAALRDVLTAFRAAEMPSPAEIEKAMTRDIARLADFQNEDGGFAVWTRGKPSIPYYSIHVTHALARAQQKGYPVPAEMLSRSLDHLRRIESYYPQWYGPQTRHALSAYALYVRDLLGDVDTAKARTLLGQYPLEQQSLEAIAWLWQVLSDDAASTAELARIRRHIANRVVETPAAANFTTSYGDDAYLMLHSNRRTDAVVLDALINDQPDSDLIPKVVNGLLAHRTRGRWGNTQENVFVLLAMDRYFNTFEDVTPDFVARFWLGETYAGEHAFQGRTTDTRQTLIPMSVVVDPARGGDAPQDLILAKEGDGRLYYRLGLRYAPTDLDLDALDMGFTVQRVYEAVDRPDDVRLDENGVWHIKAGARVRVKLTLVANNRRYHVALVDPLPAGLESINPAFAVSESLPADPNERTRGWWWWTWYEHQNLRDARAEAFTTLLWEGVYTYSYVARATTPGEFVVPPARAEEMYTPEVFGRRSSARVIIE